MNILIYGAGTIGLSLTWLLSHYNNIDLLVRKKSMAFYEDGIKLQIKDLRKKDKEYSYYNYKPKIVTTIDKEYDLIFITVNSSQLESVLPDLVKNKKRSNLLFLQNNWNIDTHLKKYLSQEDYFVGFPSFIGGGRLENKVRAIIFPQPILLGVSNEKNKRDLEKISKLFELENIKTKYVLNIENWLKVHCVQQAVFAGAIAEAKSYKNFVSNFKYIKKMILAWKEGLSLCEMAGINLKLYSPARYLSYPLNLISIVMKYEFSRPIMNEMILGHMQYGYYEWADEYYEILETGKECHLSMPIWNSYSPFVKCYMEINYKERKSE